MRILLDTSYLYDLMAAPGRLSEVERRFLSRPGTQIYVSTVSIWEMRLKRNARQRTGLRKSPFDPIAVLEGQNVSFLPITVRHAARELDTPLEHKDSFNELLLVQAQEEGLKLLTIDQQMAGHPLTVTTPQG